MSGVRLLVIICIVAVAALAEAGTASAADWLAAEEVAPATEGATQPAVTIAPSGTVVVAWKGPGQPGQHKVHYRVRAPFSGYGDIQRFGNLRNDEERPAVATDSDGRTWIAFHNITENTMQLERSSPTDPGSFPDPAVASFALSGGFPDVPDLAVRPDDAALVYVQGTQVKLARWTSGPGASTTTMYDGSSGAGMHPRVTLDASGNVVTAFTYDNGFGNPCFAKARRVQAIGGLQPIENLGQTGVDEAPQCFDNDVDLALGPTDRVLASWYDEFGDTVQSAVAAPGAAFGAPTTIAGASSTPDPLAVSLPSRSRALLGTSDATLNTYLAEPLLAAIRIAQRAKPAGGSPATQELEDGLSAVSSTVDLARNGSDQAVGSWLSNANGCHVSGGRGTVGGGLTALSQLGACGATATSDPEVAISPTGDAAAAWTADGAVELAVYDATPPDVLGVDVPATATVGQLLDLSVTSRDALSTVADTEWELADGTSASGQAIQHRFAAAGAYEVLIHVRDAAGNRTDVQRTIVVSDPAGSGGGGTGAGGGGGTGSGVSGTGGGGGGAGGGGTSGGAGSTDNGNGGQGGQGGAPRTGPIVTLTSSKLRASRRGVVKLVLGCPRDTEGGCTGDVSIQQGAAAAVATKPLATQHFTAAPGTTVTARVELSAAARKRLKAKHKLTVLVTVTAADAAGRAATGQRNAVLRPAKARRKRR